MARLLDTLDGRPEIDVRGLRHGAANPGSSASPTAPRVRVGRADVSEAHRTAAPMGTLTAATFLTLLLSLPAVLLRGPEALTFDNVQQLVGTGGGIAGLVLARRVSSGRTRTVQAALLSALVGALVGQLAWDIAALGYPPLAVLGNVSFAVGVAVGVAAVVPAMFVDLDRDTLVAVAVDSLLLFLTALMGAAALWNGVPTGPPGALDGTAAAIGAAILFSASAACGIALIARRLVPRVAGPWSVVAGIAAVGIGWFSWLQDPGTGPQSVAASDFLYTAGVILIAHGGVTWDERREAPAGSNTALRVLAWGLPSVAIIAAMAVYTTEHGGFAIGGASDLIWVVVVGAVLRQALLVVNEQRLITMQARRDVTARFERLVQHGSDLIVVLDRAMTAHYVSPSIEQILGVKPRAGATLALDEFVDPVERERVRYLVTSALLRPDGQRGDPVEIRCRHADGSSRILEAVATPTVDSSGARALVVNARDVTERRATTEALLQSEARYRAVSELISDFAYGARPGSGGLEIDWSTAGADKMHGYSTEEIADRGGFGTIVHPLDMEAWESRRASLAGGQPFAVEFRIITKDGDVRWIRDQARAELDPTSGDLVAVVGAMRDVTERRSAAEALRESEAHVRALLDGIPDQILLFDADDRFLAPLGARPPGARFSEEAVGLTVRERLPQELARVVEESHARARETGRTDAISILSDRPDGRHALELRNAPLPDGAILSVARDVTERQSAMEALQASEARVRGLLDGIPDQILRIDREGRFLEALGLQPPGAPFTGQAAGKMLDEIVTPGLARLLGDTVTTALEQRHTQDLTFSNQRPDGLHHFEARIAPIADGEVLAIIRDETAAREAAEDAARLVEVLDATPEFVCSLTLDGQFIYANPAFRDLTGMSADGEHTDMAAVLSHSPDLDRMLAETAVPAAVRDGIWHGDVEFVRQDGSAVPVSLIVLAHRAPDGSTDYVSGIGRDITQSTRIQRELVAAKEAAESASRAKGDFLATMSHEIRTPMNGIVGAAELLLGTDLTREQREFAETLEESSEALLAIINDVLDFSKIEAGRLDLEVIEFDLPPVVANVCVVLAESARRRGLELLQTIGEGVPERLRGDPTRLRQILMNLVGNAIKFTEAGEVVISVRPGGVLEDGRARIRFEVSDTGIGIAPDALARLFRPFEQADRSMSRRYGGSGLGLTISRRLAELMGGELGVRSRPGEGSVFWFTACVEPVAAAARSTDHALRGRRALVLADRPTNQAILVDHLVRWEMLTVSVERETEACEALRTAEASGSPFDVVVVDDPFDGEAAHMVGPRVTRQAGAPNVPVVLLTPLGGRLDAGFGIDTGVAAWVTKPVRASDLFDALATALSAADDVHTPIGGMRVATPPQVHSHARLLLVEDNVVNQKVARAMLARLGYAADLASTGIEALEAARTMHYDLILMDCQLPGLDGLQATELIRAGEDPEHASVIVALTANATSKDRDRCLDAGMNDYLAKPVRPESLQAVLSHWLSDPGVEEDAMAASVPAVARPAAPSEDEPPTTDAVEEMLDRAAMAEIQGLADDESEDILWPVVDLFLEGADGHVQDIHRASSNGEWETVARTCHTLKSSARTVGAAALARVAVELEAAARKVDLGRIALLEADLDRLLAESRRAFEKERGDTTHTSREVDA